MPRLWLAALGAIAVIGCGDDTSGGGPNDSFPDVAGVYAVEGTFDGFTPEEASFTGSVTIDQESLESSILSGTADILLTAEAGDLALNDVELQDASVTLSGVVAFRVEHGGRLVWTFSASGRATCSKGPTPSPRGRPPNRASGPGSASSHPCGPGARALSYWGHRKFNHPLVVERDPGRTLGPGCAADTDGAGCAADRLDDHRLAERRAHAVGEDAAHHVERAAGRKRNDHGDRTRWIALRCRGRSGRQRRCERRRDEQELSHRGPAAHIFL